jgi:hypothetical protein
MPIADKVHIYRANRSVFRKRIFKRECRKKTNDAILIYKNPFAPFAQLASFAFEEAIQREWRKQLKELQTNALARILQQDIIK